MYTPSNIAASTTQYKNSCVHSIKHSNKHYSVQTVLCTGAVPLDAACTPYQPPSNTAISTTHSIKHSSKHCSVQKLLCAGAVPLDAACTPYQPPSNTAISTTHSIKHSSKHCSVQKLLCAGAVPLDAACTPYQQQPLRDLAAGSAGEPGSNPPCVICDIA